LTDLGDRAALLELYRPPRAQWLRLNLVATVDGSVAGTDGTSESLTSRTDRRILGVIRELADVVLIGAGSARAEGYLLPKRAPLAIVTRSGDLRGHRLDDVERVTVLGPESARPAVAETLGARFVAIDPEPSTLVAALRDEGWASIVCEGGPVLATELLGAGLVDELCLTTSPQLGGRSLPMLSAVVAPIPLRLAGLLTDEDGMVFARWRTPSGAE
jgi:riboflavin biosynthesis pyrimidine reductase